MSKEKPLILIIDDEGKITEEFKSNHSNDYRIEAVTNTDIIFIKNELETTFSGINKPDLILTDLKHEVKDDKLDELKKEIWNKMGMFKALITDINNKVRLTYKYYGIELLRVARDLYGSDIPIGIYNGFGATNEYNNSKIHEEIVDLNGDWFPMRLGKNFESKKINQLLKRNGSKNNAKRITKPFILTAFREDNLFIDFIREHKDDYMLEFIHITDIENIRKTLEEQYSGMNKPDMILTSLRHLRKGVSTEYINEIWQKGQEVKNLIDHLNYISGPAYERHGDQVLKLVRDVYQDDTSVAIYTSLGLITEYKNSDVHTNVVELNGEWFQKGLDKSFESKKIRQLLSRKHG